MIELEIFLDKNKIRECNVLEPLHKAFRAYLKDKGIEVSSSAYGVDMTGVNNKDFLGPKVLLSVKAPQALEMDAALDELSVRKQLPPRSV